MTYIRSFAFSKASAMTRFVNQLRRLVLGGVATDQTAKMVRPAPRAVQLPARVGRPPVSFALELTALRLVFTEMREQLHAREDQERPPSAL